MNITRENLGDLDLLIKVEIVENDYAEKVNKQLKDYQKKATVPGFRKGMAPMGLIQRMYKSAVVADQVQELLTLAFRQEAVVLKLSRMLAVVKERDRRTIPEG